MKLYENEINVYKKLNEIAEHQGIVIFGSSFAKSIPVGELKQSFGLDYHIYNRSFTDLSIFDAKNVIDDCVLKIMPEKLLIQLGETDLERGYKTITEIITEYESLINIIREKSDCNIVLVSLDNGISDIHPDEFNNQLEKFAKRLKCQFADISSALSSDAPYIKAFSLMKRFMRDRITSCDAMTMLNYQ